jgi:uncharacterized protein DUF3574
MLTLLGIAAVLSGCTASPAPAPSPAPSCAAGDSVLVRETLYFGRNRPGGGTVSDEEWKSFLAEVVTPRFPAGLTVEDATGQWRGASGAVEQERSEVVTLFHPDDEAGRRAVHEIAQEYKGRFQQEAVLRERAAVCTKME